ncbi:MAG: C40 family peptidase [Acidimicrobiaceae bacterium]|nr:C40 family peptidase [Acidimicrobiaceae bacterium]
MTTGKITAVTPAAPPRTTAAPVPTPPAGTVPATNTVTLVGDDGATYTYDGVVGAPPVGTATKPGDHIGTAGPTGITFSIMIPDVVGQVCSTSALEAWSIGTPLNVRTLPTTCLPGDMSVLTDGTLGGGRQNVLVVTDRAAGNTATDLKTLLGGSQSTINTLNLDPSQSPVQQAAAIAASSIVKPAVAAVPARRATATRPARPARPAVPAVTSNLVVIALGSDNPAAAAALTAKLPATQQVLWVVPPLPQGTPPPPDGTPSIAAQYAAFTSAHPNVRIDWLASPLAQLTTGTVNAPAPAWSTVGSQVVASNVAGYAATAYRLPTTNNAASTVLSFAEAQLGKPYVWAAAGPNSFDCSGLTMAAFQQVGISLDHNANAQYQATRAEAVSEAQLQPGDLVFFAGDGTMTAPGHVGIYVGNGQYIDAPNSNGVVRIDKLFPGDGFVGASRPLATVSLGSAAGSLADATLAASGAGLIDTSSTDPNKGIARALVDSLWNDNQWVYLDLLWTQESGWNPLAINPTSGAFGIPQSLPANKMSSVASDWATDPTTQILWGVEYIQGTYGSPQAAWAHEVAFNWY